jgi:hypothetical protein
VYLKMLYRNISIGNVRSLFFRIFFLLITSLFGELLIHSFVLVEEIPFEIEEEKGWIHLYMGESKYQSSM